jgi:hypothetical protein
MGDTYHISARSSPSYVDDETVGHHVWVIERREWALKTMQNAIADLGEENWLDMASLGVGRKRLRPTCCEELILSLRLWLMGSSCRGILIQWNQYTRGHTLLLFRRYKYIGIKKQDLGKKPGRGYVRGDIYSCCGLLPKINRTPNHLKYSLKSRFRYLFCFLKRANPI